LKCALSLAANHPRQVVFDEISAVNNHAYRCNCSGFTWLVDRPSQNDEENRNVGGKDKIPPIF
jgi:hypothetical protein